MECEEFFLRIAPVVNRVEELCKDMTLTEFEAYKTEVLNEVEKLDRPATSSVMQLIFGLIQDTVTG